MPPLQPEGMMALQSELLSGESIVWSGAPNRGVIFHKQDIFVIPFSLLWGGFAIFWEAGVLGYWGNGARNGPVATFMSLWGVPFVVIGQYLIWGRFFYDAWLKSRTYYALTNRRILVVQKGYSRKVASAYIDSVPAINKDGGDGRPGTLTFTPQVSLTSEFFTNNRRNNWGAWNSMSVGAVPVFRDIDDLDYVYRLVSDLREKSHSAKSLALST